MKKTLVSFICLAALSQAQTAYAATTPLARWLFNEADNGTAPLVVNDALGGSPLSIAYGGNAQWTTTPAGHGMDFDAALRSFNSPVAVLSDISANSNLGTALSNATGASLTMVLDIDDGASNASRIFAIGTDGGNGDFALTHREDVLEVRWDQEKNTGSNSAGVQFPSLKGRGITVVAVSVDTTQTQAEDRVKVWYNGVPQTPQNAANIAQNSALNDVNAADRSLSIGNRPDRARNINGRVYYAELSSGQFSDQEVASSQGFLLADNDSKRVTLARWLLDEAATGTTPNTAQDSENANHLSIDFKTDAYWDEYSSGKGINFNAPVGRSNTPLAVLQDIAGNGNIGTSLQGATGLSLLLSVDIDGGASNASRIFAIGTDSGDGDFAVVHRTDALGIRWDQESGGSNSAANEVRFPSLKGLGETVVAVVIDSTQAVATERVKVWYNGIAQAPTNSAVIAQNSALDQVNTANRSVSLGNRADGNRGINGRIFYAELSTGRLTDTEIADSHTLVLADNDSSRVAIVPIGGDTTPPVFANVPSAVNQTSSGHDIQASLDEDGIIYAVRLASGSATPSSAQVKAGLDASGNTAAEAKSSSADAGTLVSLRFESGSDATRYDYYVVAEDKEAPANLQSTPSLVSAETAPLGFIINSDTPSSSKAHAPLVIQVRNGDAPYSISYNGHTLIPDSQDADSITFNSWPYPWELPLANVDFETGYPLQVTDSSNNSSSIDFKTQPKDGDDYHNIIGKPWLPSSFHSNDPAELENGDKHWGYWSVGGVRARVDATGTVYSVQDGDQYTRRIFDTSTGLWGDSAVEIYVVQTPAN